MARLSFFHFKKPFFLCYIFFLNFSCKFVSVQFVSIEETNHIVVAWPVRVFSSSEFIKFFFVKFMRHPKVESVLFSWFLSSSRSLCFINHPGIFFFAFLGTADSKLTTEGHEAPLSALCGMESHSSKDKLGIYKSRLRVYRKRINPIDAHLRSDEVA